MSMITASQYWKEVEATADRVIDRARDESDRARKESEDYDLMEVINDLLHEEVDGHEWIIYTAYNLDVIQYSENPDEYINNFGNDVAGDELKARGLQGLHTAIAFWAFYADVYDEISNRFDD